MPDLIEKRPEGARVLRILLVDDEPAIRDILAMVLKHEGHLVETAFDGRDAWEKLSADLARADLVITDSQMPRVDGMALVQLIRETEFSGKIIVFSSSLTAEKTAKLVALRVDAIVEKAASTSRLLAEVRRVSFSWMPEGE